MQQSIQQEIEQIARAAQAASRRLAVVSTDVKNAALRRMADALCAHEQEILHANADDLKAAKARGVRGALLDRLTLTSDRVAGMADGLLQLADLADPVGETIKMWRHPNGMLIGKRRIPIGVVGIIYEARPNVTADCLGLCLKSGNSVVLRGGSEAIHSNRAIFDALNAEAVAAGIPNGALQLVTSTDRAAVKVLLGLSQYINVIIPRGGESLIRAIERDSKIPVIRQYKGVCHVYVDQGADLKKAARIVLNAKLQRPGVCNAMESLLVHEKIAKKFLPSMAKELQEKGVELRGCPVTKQLVPAAKKATPEDWATEYLDLVMSVRVVPDLQTAVDHIHEYGTQHSEAIVTEDYGAAMEFTNAVDASCVYVNASTRFTDGGQFGMGAEIGISTGRLHARGPMGLEELTTYKYVIFGTGQIRA